MSNWDLTATWTYHNGTKHSYQSVRLNPHFLDWMNQPLPFKIYKELEPIPLPTDILPSEMLPLQAIAATARDVERPCIPDLTTLSRLFHFSAGITKRRDYGGGAIHFRAAACTGALYHIDLYLVCGNLPGLDAGVYHFSPHDHSLRRLRSGDYRPVLLQATAQEPHVSQAPALVVFTSTFWRNSWKYQSRAYRHTFWDCGTILANFQTVAAAQHVPASLVVSFMDSPVNRLLDVDSAKEASVAIMAVGRSSESPPDTPLDIPPLDLETAPLSHTQVDYPMIQEMHSASSLETQEEVRQARGPIAVRTPPEPDGPLFPLQPASLEEGSQESLERLIQRRGSTRKFTREAISFSQLSTILHHATTGIQTDLLQPTGARLGNLYLTVHAVEGLPSGAYVYRRDRNALEMLKEGDFRRQSAYMGLEQELPGDASADIFLLTNLELALQAMGNRGYRAAQLEASITAGKAYLAAYAQRIGASGLTFFDDEVTQFFSPHASGKSVMFLIALGKKARRPSQ